MRVIATAGHVDHGKSALVRALTGTDPDRWAEEHRRGLTIDLGYAWTRLPGGETVAVVDVPGHQRFIANMLAGVGPAPAVLFVVAADEGWRAQSGEHLDAVRALGIERAVVAITRSDLAEPGPAMAQVGDRLAGTALAGCEVVACSAVTGEGLDDLRAALARLCAASPEPEVDGRVRLWVDRVFTVRGAGTVVTGTLESGRVRVGDRLAVSGVSGARDATVRGLQSLEVAVGEATATARAAVNLRGVATDEVARGDVLLGGPWHRTSAVDARLDVAADSLPEHVMAHVGTAAVEVRVRPLAGQVARLTWVGGLPLAVGDRLVLRDPGQQRVVCGAVVLDVDPPALTRRGDGRRRGESLADVPAVLDVEREVTRRGWMRGEALWALGASEGEVAAATGSGVVRAVSGVLVAPTQWDVWAKELRAVVEGAVAGDPLQGRMSARAAVEAIGVPEASILAELAPAAGLELAEGYLSLPGRAADLGAAEPGVASLERRLAERPFAAPERDELVALGLGVKEVAAAVRLGRLVELGDAIVLAPTGPARAMRELAALPQPFTTSEARQALDTTRRVVIPLLEELDRRGWTRRVDASHREVVR
ncbi:selenocysteine-specific translation elongation factor [Mariniluteicoccus flavus]